MEDKLGTFISSLQANPNIAGLPDSTTLRNVFYDKEKAEVLFKSLKSNPNIMGLPEDYDTFAEGLGLSEQLQRPVMPELPTEEILDKQQKTNTSRSLPIYRGIAGNIPAAIFNKKLDKAVEKGELPEEDVKEIKKITEQNKWGDLGRSLGVSVLGAGEMALKTPQGLGGLAADISTRIQFPGMNRQINKAVKEGKMTVEQGNELWKTLQAPAFNPKTGQFEQGFIYGENLAESKLTKWFEDNQQKLKEQMTYTDKEIWDYIKEGDIEKAIWATAYGVTESLVPTILAAFTKQGAALLGLGTGSVTYDEVKDREDMMANKKIIDAVGQGVFEWFFEALFTKQMGDQFKAILKAKGPEGLKAAINSEATKNLIGKAFKKFGVWFNPVGEGVSELLTTLGQNAVAKYTGEDPTRKISDGAIDALIVGMGMGGGFSAIEGVAKKFKERPSDGQRTEDPVKPPTDDTTTEKQSTLDDIREQAKSEEQRIANEAKEMTREGTDEISFVTLANDSGDIAEKPRYVLKDAINEGKKEVVLLEIDPEGKLTGKKVMKMVSDLDVDKETGKVAMTTVKADEHVAAQINTMRETAQSAMNIMAKELSGLNEGDIFSEDGIRYVIEEVSTDGVAVSRLNEEGYVTGESELWSPDEVKEAMNAPTPADTQQAAPAEKVQQEAPETGTEEVDQPTTPQEQQQAAPVEQTQPQEQEQEQQKVEYPKDKEGNIDYNQITETGTYAEALEQEFGETSVSIVDEFIKNINEDIEKAGKGKDPIKKAREIKKLNDRLAFLDGVRNIIAPVREQELTDKARETTEQLEQVQERPPVQEAQVETVVPETKAADTARPINTRSKRKGWPMSKADQERLIKEPQSFEEAVLQFFLGGGRMSMDDYYTHFGKSREEMRKNIWMYSKKGQRLDALNENSIFASYPHLLRGLDGPMDMENAVFEVIRSHSGKNSIRERLDEIQNKPLEPEVPEDIQAEQNTDFEVENSEITGNDVIDEQLLSIFEEYYDNGEIDFSRLSEDLENDVGWFTVFPYNLSEQETNELKNILENADKRTKITDRVRNIVEPESGSQRDDTRDRTEEVERGDSGDRIPRVAETEATGTTPDTRGEVIIDEAAIEGTPQKAQIDLLNTEKENLKAKRNNLDAEFARRNGLFGDTQADPNDLFGGLQALDPNAYRQQIKGINDRLAEIDRQTEILYQNALTSLKESQGQQEITPIGQETTPQEPSETDSKDVAQFQIVQEENPLVVLHNTTEDKLIKSNRAGGLAMPSIAITKPSIGLSGFGDITLIGSKEVIDPQRTGTNKVYGADAYTPRYPNVVYTIGDKNALNNALKDIKDESVKNDIISGIENHIEREGDSYFDENKSVQLAFALNKGADVIVMRKTDLPREVIDFAEKTEGYDYLSIQGNEKAKTELNNVLLNSLDNKTKTLFERTGALKDGQISEKTLRSYFNEAKNWIRARNKVDFYGSEQNARDYIQKNNLQNEVKRFARDLYEQLNVNEKIFRGYTRTGNRRYAPHTVENAVREMKTEGNQGAENFFAGGLGYVRAILAPRFKSIDQIKDASSRLVDNATSKAEFDRLDNLHKSLIEEIKPYYKYVADWFNEATAFGEEIKDLVKNGHSESFNQIPNELQAKIKQFAEDVVALPTDYFEAKPERGVMLSEFTAAVVPENTDSRVISILENNGLKVHKYGDNNRMEVVDRVSKDNNVLFQIASPLGYYSTVENALNNIPQIKDTTAKTPTEWKKNLLKFGAKQAELDWMGFDDYFKSPNNFNYKLDNNNAEYYVRFSYHIEDDLKRGWSSWNFGGDGFSGTQNDLINDINRYRTEYGGEFGISGFNIWIDNETNISSREGVVFIENYEIRELYPNYWVVVDRINARNGLSAHILPDNLSNIGEAVSIIENNPTIYDGTGDGESFNSLGAKVIYSGTKDGKDFHIIEVGENKEKQPKNTITKTEIQDWIDQNRIIASSLDNSVSQETETIKKEARANGTFMKAPNGKPTNLNERQWLQVRTKAFKEWFGDWEKATRIEKLRGSKAVELTGDEYKGKYELNRDSGHKWILDNLRGEYTIKDTGEKVRLSRVSANELTSHGEREDIHLKSFAFIPQMIENAVFIEEQSSYKNKKYDSYRYYVVGLKVGGVDYTARIVVGVKNGKNYYDHELTQIEKGNIIDNLNRTTTSVVGSDNTLSDIKDKRLISLLQTNSSKVVDENGEPLVQAIAEYNGTFDPMNSDIMFRILGETGASRLENAETVLNDLRVAREMENGGQHLSDAADFFFSQIPEELKVEARKYNRAEDAEAMKKIQADPKAKAAWANYIRAHEHLKEWQSLGEQEQKKRIRLATGWERGADGKWRYEVADNINIDKQVFNSLRSGETYNTVKLPELIGQDNDLFITYPRLREIDVARNNMNGAAVYSSGGNGQITINDKLTSLSAKSPLIHEIQHAIQAIEGFARGGNLKTSTDIANKKLSDAELALNNFMYKQGDKTLAEIEAMPEYQALDNDVKIAKLEAENPSINYRRLAGEVEARNTETRENFTPEQRRETLLSETEDVAREEQIVLRQVLGEQSRTSPITETILELLEKAGIEVVMEKEAYNKAKEELLKANGVELKDGKGKVYGFAYQEKIYLDPDLVNPNTPIHEYTHLWDMALMKMDLELWDKGINLLKQTPEWNRVVNDPNYANIRHSDDLIASEVHARLVGKDGPAILQEMIDNAKAESPVSHMEALSVVDRIKRWLKQVYVKLFGNKVKNSGDLTLEQWISMPIKDLFEGKRITGEYLEKSPENVKFTDKTEQHGSEGQQREQGTDAIRAPRLGSEPGSVRETHRILDELRHDVRGEGQDSGGTTATDNKAEGSERRKLQALATAEVRAKETGAWIGRNELSEIIDDGYRFTSGQERRADRQAFEHYREF